MADHLVSEALYLHDPDGLGIEVYADRPRGAWPRRGDRIVMASDPLDTASLLQDAADQPWAGMPQGTVMGHVHLSVDDLDTAERFYGRAMGLDVTTRDYPGALFLSAGGYHHHLGTNTWSRGAEPAGSRDARMLEWELRLPDPTAVEGARESLEAAGYAASLEGPDVVAADPWDVQVRLRPAAAPDA
jgi:catechol 2,3-dioxygenase